MSPWILATAAASPPVIEVGGAGPYPDLGAALAAPPEPGSTLRLHTGVYPGSYQVFVDGLVIEPWGDGPVTLVVDDPANDPAVYENTWGALQPNGVTLTIRDVEIDGNGNRIAKVNNGGHLVLERVVAHDAVRTGVNHGGAVFVEHAESHATITDCTFRDNVGTGSGGVLATAVGATAWVSGTRFERNRADQSGGAVYCQGSCEITDNVFVGNTAYADGGAVLLRVGTGSTVRGNVFIGNEAHGDGGALVIREGASVAELDYNVFWSNTAARGGGVWADASLLLRNTDLLDNVAAEGGALFVGGGSVSALNTILVDDGAKISPLHAAGGASLGVSHLLYEGAAPLGNAAPADEVAEGDPAFVDYRPKDPEGSDLSLQPISPAVCAGDGVFDDHLGAYTDVPEVPGDGVDSDCNGLELCYVDGDGDGHGGPAVEEGDLECDREGLVATSTDCDDSDPEVAPGRSERPCNDLDDDCDPTTADRGDQDGDGVDLCDGDCADTDPTVHPGAAEACNQRDDDCDAEADEDGACDPDTETGTGTGTCDTNPDLPACDRGAEQLASGGAVPAGCGCGAPDPSTALAPALLAAALVGGRRRRR